MIETLLPVEVQRAREKARKNNSPDYLGPASSVEALAPPGAEINPVNDVQEQVVKSECSISDQATPGNAHSLLFNTNNEISLEVSATATGDVGENEFINENWLTLYRKEFLELVDFAKRSSRKTKQIARFCYGFRKLDRRIKLSFRMIREILGLSRSSVKRASTISSGTRDLLENIILMGSRV